jgi:hypothetical protein
MRPIGIACIVAVLAAVPAHATEPDWKAANLAYASAREKAKPPSDYPLCAGSWAAWDDALYDGKLSDTAVASLDPDLQIDGADAKVNLWRLWLGDDDRSLDAFDMQREAAGTKIGEALGGDKDALGQIMQTLGACQLPKDK